MIKYKWANKRTTTVLLWRFCLFFQLSLFFFFLFLRTKCNLLTAQRVILNQPTDSEGESNICAYDIGIQTTVSECFIYLFIFWSSNAAITKFQFSVFCVIPVFSSYTFTSPQMTIQWSEYEHQFNRKLVNSLTVNCEPLHLGYNIQIWKR